MIKKDMYFFVPDEIAYYLFSDVIKDTNCCLVFFKRSFIGKLLLSETHLFSKLLSFLGLRNFVSKFSFCYEFDKKILSSKDNIFVFVGDSLNIGYQYIKHLSKANKAIYIALILDSFNASSPTVYKTKNFLKQNVLDGIYSYDDNDCDKYNWKKINKNYFSTSAFSKIKFSENPTDCYFIGGLKGDRTGLILELFENLRLHNIYSRFELFCMNKKQFKNRKFKDEISYLKKWIPYSNVVQSVYSTNCIIEILQKNQLIQSARYFEALYFNKKLLSNNPNLKELPFYDERYMRYFEKVEDVDFDWIRKKEEIDYGYKGEFSPLNLVKMIRVDFS